MASLCVQWGIRLATGCSGMDWRDKFNFLASIFELRYVPSTICVHI